MLRPWIEWFGSLGCPPNANFLLGLFFKIEFGLRTDYNVGGGKIVAFVPFAIKFKSWRRTFFFNVASLSAFGLPSSIGVASTTPLPQLGQTTSMLKIDGLTWSLPRDMLVRRWHLSPCSHYGRFGTSVTQEFSDTTPPLPLSSLQTLRRRPNFGERRGQNI